MENFRDSRAVGFPKFSTWIILNTKSSINSQWCSFLVAQIVKNPPATQETQVQSPRREDPLEKEMATHSSIFAQRVLWTEEPGGLQSMGHKELDMTEWLVHTHTHTHTHTHCTREKMQWCILGKPNDKVTPLNKKVGFAHDKWIFPLLIILRLSTPMSDFRVWAKMLQTF